METYHQYGPHVKDQPYWKWDKKKGWIWFTNDWLYADSLRAIEDNVDEGNFSSSTMTGWKYDGEP
jgi:hypothetical protein